MSILLDYYVDLPAQKRGVSVQVLGKHNDCYLAMVIITIMVYSVYTENDNCPLTGSVELFSGSSSSARQCKCGKRRLARVAKLGETFFGLSASAV